jgi:hypothetical protein
LANCPVAGSNRATWLLRYCSIHSAPLWSNSTSHTPPMGMDEGTGPYSVIGVMAEAAAWTGAIIDAARATATSRHRCRLRGVNSMNSLPRSPQAMLVSRV